MGTNNSIFVQVDIRMYKPRMATCVTLNIVKDHSGITAQQTHPHHSSYWDSCSPLTSLGLQMLVCCWSDQEGDGSPGHIGIVGLDLCPRKPGRLLLLFSLLFSYWFVQQLKGSSAITLHLPLAFLHQQTKDLPSLMNLFAKYCLQVQNISHHGTLLL